MSGPGYPLPAPEVVEDAGQQFMLLRGGKIRMRINDATKDDEVLDRLTGQDVQKRMGAPTGLTTHLVRFQDGTYGIRHHSWNQRCPHCRT